MMASLPLHGSNSAPFCLMPRRPVKSYQFERVITTEPVHAVLVACPSYDLLGEDGMPSKDRVQVVNHPDIIYLLALEMGVIVGLLTFRQETSVCFDVHVIMLPSARGMSDQILSQGIQWIWANTTCQRVIGKVPSFNRLALRLARVSGMIEFGVNRNSFMKYGKLHDQVMFGISRPEVICRF